jgi:hypothetical protein
MKRFFRDFARLIGRYRRGLFITLVALFGMWCLALVASYQLTTQTQLCDSCHYEEPFMESWLTSSHSDVDCHECHKPTTFGGKLNRGYDAIRATVRYWNGTHEKIPRAEIDDSNCLASGCHDQRLSDGSSDWIKNIQFNHDHHVGLEARGIKLHCSSCHSQIVQGSHMEVTGETCFLCHFKNLPRGEALAGCNCHSVPDDPVQHEGLEFRHSQYVTMNVGCADCHVDVVEGNGNVPKSVCRTCHTVRLDTYDDVEFTHRKHVDEHHVDCASCHEPVQHHDVNFARSLETTCSACHGGTHNPQRDVFMGIGAKGLEPFPSVMFKAQVGCDGCHREDPITTARSEPARAIQGSCVACHGLGFDDMLDEWGEMLERFFAQLDPLYQRADLSLAAAGDGAPDSAREGIEQARYNLDFLREGHGQHNMVYAKLIFLKVQEDLNAAIAALDSGWQVETPLPFYEDDLRGNCTQTCHINMREMQQVTYQDMTLTHFDHVYKHEMECTYCHDNSKVHGEVRTQRENCLTCHHTQETRDCTDCHGPQQKMIAGRVGFGIDETPAMMVDLECEDCHVDLHGENNRTATLTTCVDCHEEGYDEFVTEWQDDTQERVGELELSLAEFLQLMTTARPRGIPSADIAIAEHAKNEALQNLEVVRNDRSGGAHNPEAAEALLDVAAERIARARELVDDPAP